MPSAVKQKIVERMEAATEHLKIELGGIRTGRASLALLDGVKVDYYGTPTPLKQVANLGVPESRLLTVQPWEPSLIKERRKDLTRLCKKHGEDSKVGLRTVRRDGNEELKHLHKDSKLSEDDL